MKVVVTSETLSYSETTNLKIYGRDCEHTDANESVRVAKPWRLRHVVCCNCPQKKGTS